MSQKYWDIIPPKKPAKRQRPNYEELIKKLKGSTFGKDETTYHSPFTQVERPCLHTSCSNCNGTGSFYFKGIKGPCLHMVSCPCPRCSGTMLSKATLIC